MAIKTLYLGSEGPFKYDDTELLNDPDGLFSGMLQRAIVTDGVIDGTLFGGFQCRDLDSSHLLDMKWNEDDVADRILNFKVNGGSRTLDLSENLIIGDGFDITITAEDIASSIVLDKQSFEVEGEGTATRLLKLINASDASATLTIDGVNGKVDQDVASGASPSFAGFTKVGGASDYFSVEADGTIKFTGAATVWDDANVGALNLGAGPASTRPTVVTYTDETGADTGVGCLGFDINESVSGVIEIPHSYKEGSDIYFHVHWQGPAAVTGTDYVKWELTYLVAQIGETLNAAVPIYIESPYDTQYETVLSAFPAITGTNFKIGDQFAFKLKRIAADGDAYVGDANVFTVGLHYEKDTVGSRQIITK